MAGLVPATHALQKSIVEILPFRVLAVDQPHLPCPRPMLDVSLALPRDQHVVILLDMDEPLEPVPFSEALDQTGAVFPRPSRQIIGDPV